MIEEVFAWTFGLVIVGMILLVLYDAMFSPGALSRQGYGILKSNWSSWTGALHGYTRSSLPPGYAETSRRLGSS